MRLRKMRQILKNHPNLLDPYCKMTEKEAENRLKNQEIPSFEQIWEGAKQKSNLPAESWPTLSLNEAAGRKGYTKIYRIFRNIKNFTKWHWRPRGVVLAAVMAVILFFSLTDTGRAFAKEVYSTVSNIVDNVLYIRKSSNAEPTGEPVETKTETLESFEDVVGKIGKRPIVAATEKVNLESISLDIVGTQTYVISTYKFGEGKSLILRQMWSDDIEQMRDVAVGLDNAEHYKGTILGNTTLEGAIHEDGSISSVAMLSDSNLYVLSEDAENTLLILKDLHIYYN